VLKLEKLQTKPRQNRTKTGQTPDKTGKTGQNRTKQDKPQTKQDKQDKTGQNRTKQDKTGQNRTKLDKIYTTDILQSPLYDSVIKCLYFHEKNSFLTQF
jgi:hypothetical protein